jgi:hypothetical protein
MKILVVSMTLGLVGCGAFRMDQQEYILKLAEKCEQISITPQKTNLTCPNYVDGKNGTNTSTKNTRK